MADPWASNAMTLGNRGRGAGASRRLVCSRSRSAATQRLLLPELRQSLVECLNNTAAPQRLLLSGATAAPKCAPVTLSRFGCNRGRRLPQWDSEDPPAAQVPPELALASNIHPASWPRPWRLHDVSQEVRRNITDQGRGEGIACCPRGSPQQGDPGPSTPVLAPLFRGYRRR